MSSACRICGNARGNESFVAREMMFGFGDEFEYFMCSECGCLQISQMPQNLSKYYPASYYSFSARELPKSNALTSRVKRLRTLHCLGGKSAIGGVLTVVFGQLLLPSWVKEGGIDVDSKILDVGCGAGHLIARLQTQGFSDLTGVDPYIPADRCFGNGIRIFKRELADVDETFDFIMLHHSFEHVTHSLQMLRTLHEKTRPGGAVLIRIPVVPSFVWDEYGTDWVQLDAPRHLYLHSLTSMDFAAKRTGFEIASVEFDSTGFQFWGSEQYRRGIPLEDPRSLRHGTDESVFSHADIEEFERMSRELNATRRGDQACFILRREPRSS